jgi:hypothetical protein
VGSPGASRLVNARLPENAVSTLTDSSWPGPDLPERQLFGVSMRTTGFRRRDQKLKDPQSTHRSRRRFSQATTGLPWNLTFARAGEKVVDGHSGRSRMPIDHRDNFGAEPLHPKVTNWH